jgi:hypothetical protein
MQKLIYTNLRGQSVELKNTGPFLLQKFDPDTPKSTILSTKAPGQDGKTYHGTLLEERVLNIEVAVFGDNSADMYMQRKKLCSIFNPKLTGTLTYINDGGEYKINCSPLDSPSPKSKHEPVQEFLIQLSCPNPYWLDIFETKEEIALWQGDFEFPLEITSDGIEMGHRVSTLIVNANNTGDVECSMTIEFRALASVVNPSILNVYTQEYIKIKRTLVAGDKLVIDTKFGDKKVEMIHNGVAANVFYYIDLSSTFLQLDVGDNLLRYDAEQGIDNLEVAIYFTPKYVGV